ncbi:UNVERIFIED_CONTAM: hypothetical protein NCL1_43247 [Trichonephila clavipes]
MRNVLLCETKIPFPRERIVPTLGSEKVLQPSLEELTFEPNSHAIALDSTKRDLVIPQGIVLAELKHFR